MNKNLLYENTALLKQGKNIISEINDSHYNYDSQSLCVSSPGMHFRHILDFYLCFISGIERHEIDYDRRDRNQEISSDREICKKRIDHIISSLDEMNSIDMDSRILCTTIEGITGNSSNAESTIGRELQFLLSHTIHHYALIALILRIQKIDVRKDFGVARSTIEHYGNY